MKRITVVDVSGIFLKRSHSPFVATSVSKTSTQTGLKVTVGILDKTYKAGRKVAEKLKSTLSIVNDKVLPAWNYTISPQVT